MEHDRYSHIVSAVTETPWALRPEKLATILNLVALRAAGEKLSDEEIRARVGVGTSSRQASSAGSVAILPLYGVLVPRANLMTEMSGATSLEQWSASFASLVENPQVTAILVDVNSPGGLTDLVPETAAVIRGARGSKPIVAIANTDAASAAYWLAAQADEIVVTPSGEVGSIGVFAAHDDISAMQEMIGVKTTLVSAGRFKTELSPFAPLSDEARSAIQAKVDTFYSMFVADVAAGRGVSEQAVRDGFGQGRMVTAAAAAEAGMVDRVDTFDATVQRLLEQRPSRSRRSAVAATDDSAATLAEQSDAVRVAAADLLKRTRSLAEFRDRGRLGASKREHLTACTEELRDVVAALAGVLAETDPVKQHTDVLREAARFERGRTATL